ncbi:MAG: hypothetical protein EXX96DRAFT_266414 [Benjaminiella poitrasii]|nr:MAG: hypothetical protein EXX96DRAFT_266414 [Benjaminiella poitrasii]
MGIPIRNCRAVLHKNIYVLHNNALSSILLISASSLIVHSCKGSKRGIYIHCTNTLFMTFFFLFL